MVNKGNINEITTHPPRDRPPTPVTYRIHPPRLLPLDLTLNTQNSRYFRKNNS